MPYRAILSAVRLPYPSFIRWRMRRNQEVPLVRQPGPPCAAHLWSVQSAFRHLARERPSLTFRNLRARSVSVAAILQHPAA